MASTIQENPLVVAAVWVHIGANGSAKWSDICTKNQINALYRIYKTRHISCMIIFIYMIVGFFELPAWCFEKATSCTKAKYAFFGFPIIPLQYSSIIQMVCMTYMMWRMNLRKRALGTVHFWSSWKVFAICMLALSQLDCLLTLLNFISSFRLRDAVRPFVFVAITKPAREGFICVFSCNSRIQLYYLVDRTTHFVLCVVWFCAFWRRKYNTI